MAKSDTVTKGIRDIVKFPRISSLSSLIRNRCTIQKGYYYRTPWAGWLIRSPTSMTRKGRAVDLWFVKVTRSMFRVKKQVWVELLQMICTENVAQNKNCNFFCETAKYNRKNLSEYWTVDLFYWMIFELFQLTKNMWLNQ